MKPMIANAADDCIEAAFILLCSWFIDCDLDAYLAMLTYQTIVGPSLARADVRNGVKTGKARCEHMFSAVHPTTDIAKILRHVRFVPARSGHQRQLILSETEVG